MLKINTEGNGPVCEDIEASMEEINKKIGELEKHILLWELQVRYEKKQNAFRELYMEWYDERITLDDVLELMMQNGLCQRISVFARD